VPEPTRVDFYFDSLCPWAWRTSLWIRDVAAVRPIEVPWKPFSLAIVNNVDPTTDQARKGFLLGRTLIAAARCDGNAGVDRLYRAFGDAIHRHKLDPLLPQVVVDALSAAGLPPDLADSALRDDSTESALLASHAEGRRLGAFGVPTLVLDGSETAVFGPVIDPVPSADDALQLWDMTVWTHRQPFLWEFKRDRHHRPSTS
jgi:2-hydroxychromene-2-carboxylate isomerase